jgi:hypothetical protein
MIAVRSVAHFHEQLQKRHSYKLGYTLNWFVVASGRARRSAGAFRSAGSLA